MALMETHYYSSSLGSNITLNVFVPTPGSSEQITQMGHSAKYDYENGLPVLYLLHGAYGDAFSWVRYSNIDRYAQDRGIVVVMASAENSFYQDLRSGKKYKTLRDCIRRRQPGTTTTIRFIGRIALGIRTNLPGAIMICLRSMTGM